MTNSDAKLEELIDEARRTGKPRTIRQLGKYPSEKIGNVLLELLNDQGASEAIVDACVKVDLQSAGPVFLSLLRESSPWDAQRWGYIDALGRLGFQGALDTLIDIASDPKSHGAFPFVASSLGRLHDERARTVLEELSRSRDPFTAEAAQEALCLLDHPVDFAIDGAAAVRKLEQRYRRKAARTKKKESDSLPDQEPSSEDFHAGPFAYSEDSGGETFAGQIADSYARFQGDTSLVGWRQGDENSGVFERELDAGEESVLTEQLQAAILIVCGGKTGLSADACIKRLSEHIRGIGKLSTKVETYDKSAYIGFLWGHQIRKKLGWQWRRIAMNGWEGTALCSPNREYVCFPIEEVYEILHEKGRDNTLEQSYRQIVTRDLPSSSPGRYTVVFQWTPSKEQRKENSREKVDTITGGPMETRTGPELRYADGPRGFESVSGQGHFEEISQHIELHVGPAEMVFHEIVSDAVHIDVLHVTPSDRRKFHTLVTSGMSDRPMVVPDPGIQAQLELTVTLPADWPLEGLLRTDGEESSEDENWYWPIRLLKFLARFPHKFETWLGSGHTTTNGDPPVPFAPDTKLCGALVAPSILSPKEFGLLELDDVTIEFLSVIPLYREEIDLKKRFGADVLLKKLEKNQITELIDPQRKNVAKKRFGLF